MTTFTKNAKWIGSGEGGFEHGCISPATELRRTLTLDSLPESAELLISGVGYYALYINGVRVGDDVLSPAFTDYTKTVLYLRYDVLRYLTLGENVIAVRLGDGFFNVTTADDWHFESAPWRNKPRLLLELFADGESSLSSDGEWQVRQDGAVVHNAIRTGEHYDARREDGWRLPGYTGEWSRARLVAPPGGRLREMTMPPVRECETLEPIAVWEVADGVIYDFGKNTVGYATLTAEAPRGSVATVRYSEILSGGDIDRKDLSCFVHDGEEYQTDKYIFRGEGVEVWQPELVYHGFRYAKLSFDGAPTPKDALTAHFVHTDLRVKGSFDCSDSLVKWIYDAGVRSFLSNYQGLPLDCPHREKNGWTGDAVISADYAAFMFDMSEAWGKWLGDISDAQRESGQIPGIVPSTGWGYNWGSGPAWDYALFYLPYVNYVETGDVSSLSTVLPTAAAYLEYAERREDADGLVCYGIPDWCPPRRLGELNLADNRLTDSCYYYSMNLIMSRLCALCPGWETDATRYLEKAEEIKKNIRRKFYTGADLGTYGQGALAFLLQFDIVEGEEAEALAARLAELVEREGCVHRVGILGMKALPNALSRYGYTSLAYKMLTREDYPSYGYWRSLGETTLCEIWEEGQSRNHHMYSDAVNWVIRNVAGLCNAGVAYDEVLLTPYVTGEVEWASASTETPRGSLSFSWRLDGKRFTAELLLPEGSTARLILGDAEYPVESGKIEIDM